MKLSALAGGTDLVLRGPDRDLPLKIKVDSRQMKKGEGFVALRGANVDGHRFIPDVLAAGASVVVCETASFQEDWQTRYPECTFILSPVRCERGLATLAQAYLEALPDLRDVIAITGSVGKTSTKNDTQVLLEKHFKLHTAGGNYNTLIGGAVTILAAPEDTQIMLLEMGANHNGEIAEMVRYFEPTVTAITEIAPAHLESFHSLEGVLAAKTEILSSKKLRCAVINGDNALLCEKTKKFQLPRVLCFGHRGDVTFSGERLRWEKGHFAVSAVLTGLDGISFNFSLPLAGVHQLYPLSCAVAIAGLSGLKSQEIASELHRCRSVEGRGEICHSENGAAILDECYNASPAAMLASLEAIGSAGIPGRRFVVFGEMLELGEASARLHERVLKRALQVSDELYLFGTEWSKVKEAEPFIFDDLEELISEVDNSSPGEGDVILVKGSRGNHLERVVKALEL